MPVLHIASRRLNLRLGAASERDGIRGESHFMLTTAVQKLLFSAQHDQLRISART